MILTSVKIENFKKIHNVKFNLNTVTILVGMNGSGKSSILQALHLACCCIRQASEVRDKSSTIDYQELDYLPTENYELLMHNGTWGNKSESPSSSISLNFLSNTHKDKDGNAKAYNAQCILRSARNSGISVRGEIDNSLTALLRNKKLFFSAYIPGISGIPNQEEKKSKKVIMKTSSFGDSNIILRNVLLLLNEDSNNIKKIEEWLEKILKKQITFEIKHNEEEDLIITCNVVINDQKSSRSIPIELLGTGFLQLIQIFCYILLFKPKLLLIDEPDIHLHPDVQEKIIPLLAEISKDQNIKTIVTTHSPFIVRGATNNTNIYYMNDGEIQQQNKSQVSYKLGWGIFGKKYLILTEDANTDFLDKILSQWDDLKEQTSILSGNGYAQLPTPEKAKQFKEFLGNKYDIIIHRDRDAMTDEEVNALIKEYSDQGIKLWVTADSDIEAYFCTPEFIQKLLNDKFSTLEEVENLLNDIFQSHKQPIIEQFNKQRKAINEKIYKEGGSPKHEDVFCQLEKSRKLKGAKGKEILKQLTNKLNKNLNLNLNNLIQTNKLDGSVAVDLKYLLLKKL